MYFIVYRMFYRFLRENSQIVAASISSGYCLLYMLYKNNECDIFRESHYEFKNKKKLYEGLTIEEEEKLRKFLFRLSGTERKIDFFRSNTFDFVSFSFNKTRNGAQIGIPTVYLSKSKEEFLRDEPLNGFNVLLGQHINFETLRMKLDTDEAFMKFLDTCLLSEEAKLFSLASAISKTNHFLLSSLDAFIDFFVFGVAYTYCYSKNRQYKLHLYQRRRMYIGSIILGICTVVIARFFLYNFIQKLEDKESCSMGLDCSEGSIEFYEKLINRNKILRDTLVDGASYFDKEGNYMMHIINIPFTNKYFFVNYMGCKLTERKKLCQNELNHLLIKLNKGECMHKLSELELEEKRTKENIKSNELGFFKNIRLKIEDLKTKPPGF